MPKSGNPNPYQGRIAQRAKARELVDVDELREIYSRLIRRVDELTRDDDSMATLKEAGYLLNQLGSSYLKLVEVGELEARHAALKREVDELKASRLAA